MPQGSGLHYYLRGVPLDSTLGPVAATPYNARPAWLAFDAKDDSFWVATPPNAVDVLPVSVLGTDSGNLSVSAQYTVGTGAFGVAADGASGMVFVTNAVSNNVTMINGTMGKVVGSVPVPSGPMGIVFDAGDDDAYVADSQAANVTVISESQGAAVGNISVGAGPIGLALDAKDDRLFVADSAADQVSVINLSNDAVLTSIPVGKDPVGVAWDNVSDEIYVTNNGSSNLTVIDGRNDTVVTWINVSGPYGPVELEGIAFDARIDELWVGAGYSSLALINAVNQTVADVFDIDPAGVAYDPVDGMVCFTNTFNRTFECLVPTSPLPLVTYPVSVHETGLPAGTSWSVTVYPQTTGWYEYVGIYNTVYASPSSTSTLQFSAANGTYTLEFVDRTLEASLPYNRTLTVDGGPVDLSVDFSHSFFPVYFNETNLPRSSEWGVTIYVYDGGDLGVNSTSYEQTVVIDLPNGTYSYTATILSGPESGTTERNYGFNVQGAALSFSVSFPALPPVQYNVTFFEKGLPADAANWSVEFHGVTISALVARSIDFMVYNGTYSFTVAGVGNFAPDPANGSVLVAGDDFNISIDFSQVVFTVTFQETGLPDGTGWAVALGSNLYTTLSDSLVFQLADGTYPYFVLSVGGYVSPPSSTFTVAGQNVTVALHYSPVTYPVILVELGLPNGTLWSATISNATLGINDTESTNGTALLFFVPNGTYAITVHVPGYQANLTSPTFTVAGQRIVRGSTSIRFVSVGRGPGRTTGASSGLGDAVWALLAFPIALAIGLGLVVRRRQVRRRGGELLDRMRELEGPDPVFRPPRQP